MSKRASVGDLSDLRPKTSRTSALQDNQLSSTPNESLNLSQTFASQFDRDFSANQAFHSAMANQSQIREADQNMNEDAAAPAVPNPIVPQTAALVEYLNRQAVFNRNLSAAQLRHMDLTLQMATQHRNLDDNGRFAVNRELARAAGASMRYGLLTISQTVWKVTDFAVVD